jgi:cytochrome c
MGRHSLLFVFIVSIIVFPGCIFGKTDKKDKNQAIAATTKLNSDQVGSNPQKDHGIGPVKNVELGPINNKMVDEGKSIFNNKCIVCHDMDQKKIGPLLRNITKERTPEYIMNLLVNSVQMQKDDPFVKELLKKYNNVLMPDPGINQVQARSVLEYLRSMSK